MFSVNIKFEIKGKRDDDKAIGGIYSYLSACRLNGQLCDSDWPVLFSDNNYSVRVSIPERNSLSKKYCNKHVLERLDDLRECDLKRPVFAHLGKELESCTAGRVENSDWYILFTTHLNYKSPIRGGVDFRPIPLYRFPKPCNNVDFYDILDWDIVYKNCDSLQMRCGIGEKFALREMSNIDSSLTKAGLDICKKMSSVTKKPFYYYLYKYNGVSLKRESERVCPKCGSKKWRLDEPLFDCFDFKCDKCRLLSSIAFSVK